MKLLPVTLPEHKIVFLHIPKTAGTTFNSFLSLQFARKTIYYHPAYDRNIYPNQIQKLLNLPNDSLTRGHIGIEALEYISEPCSTITFLRQPLARALSHYQMNLNLMTHYPETHQHYTEMVDVLEFSNLTQYLEQKKPIYLDNLQVRYLIGNYDNFGVLSETHLNEAKQNLHEKISCFGITDRFDHSLAHILDSLSWNTMPFYKLGKRAEKVKYHQVDPPGVEKLKELNELDGLLYEYAVNLFEDRIKSLDYGSYQKKIKYNKYYQTMGKTLDLIPKKINRSFINLLKNNQGYDKKKE